MIRYPVLLWTFVLASCQAVTVDPGCKPSSAEKRAWVQTEASRKASAYREFLQRYPQSCYAPVATERLRGAVMAVPVAGVGRRTAGSPGGPGNY